MKIKNTIMKIKKYLIKFINDIPILINGKINLNNSKKTYPIAPKISPTWKETEKAKTTVSIMYPTIRANAKNVNGPAI